jgi:putative glutathione S-transferase
MGFLVGGVWHGSDSDQIGAKGWEPRRESFNGYVRGAEHGEDTKFPAEKGRYHLILCPGCPLSHRTLMVLGLKGLGEAISTTIVRPIMGPNGREFGTPDKAEPDDVTGDSYLYQTYLASDPNYSGRDSTPVLWDRKTRKIVSNNYRDIVSMLNHEFDSFADPGIDLQPADLKAEIDRELSRLSTEILGSVYRCGFSRSQEDYELHASMIGETIPKLAAELADKPFLLGDRLTEPDLALFACLVRFDAIYIPLFRCTRERIEDHPSLTEFIKRVMALPGVAGTFDLRLTMTHYYKSHVHINPTKIVPLVPKLSWL